MTFVPGKPYRVIDPRHRHYGKNLKFDCSLLGHHYFCNPDGSTLCTLNPAQVSDKLHPLEVLATEVEIEEGQDT